MRKKWKFRLHLVIGLGINRMMSPSDAFDLELPGHLNFFQGRFVVL